MWGKMFGIKKLKDQNESLAKDTAELYHLCNEMDQKITNNNKEINKYLLDQKLDLSKINTRFQDLWNKFDKTLTTVAQLSEFSEKATQIHEELLDKIITDDAIMQHIKELNEKMVFLFDYMKQLEKLLGNVEIIVDQCLPELTIKLPKKKKASTRAS